MSRVMNKWMLAAVACCLMMALPALAAGKGNLVSVAWLGENIQREDVLLIDASPGQLYATKHIPGAINVDVFSFGGRDNSATDMEKLFQSWGVSPGKKIVIYDQGGTYLATSLFFDLYYHGFPAANMFVLDGGMAKWQAHNGAVTKDPSPPPKPGNFRVSKLKEDVRVRLPEILVASGDPVNNALVEGLEHSYHFGAAKFFNRAGHIPNAISAPSADFFNADKTFKSPEEIRRMLAYLGIKPEQQVYSHCGGGIAASVPFFAMKIMLDYPKVKLYKESQHEWLRDERGLPYWTYDAPNLMREKSWLSGWGSPMMRMFGMAKLSVIDVRPAEAYQQGHVPYAVNIPANVFRAHLANPARLAEMLGAAGVDANHEAVIVGEKGLNGNAALAFLMLEKLGQRRVSVLTDSLDDWGTGSFQLTKEPTVIGPAKSPKELAVPLTTYKANVRAGIMTNELPSVNGPYPKIYIASGKAVPAKTQDGKLIHVPYTELVNADGTPKAAADIWGILSKAGLPRYAEIICISDEPGEAAANYFILKLMGFPDVKVLV